MGAIEIKPDVKVNLEEILQGVSKLNLHDLEQFHQKVGGLLSIRKARSIPEREHALTAKITEEFLPKKSSQKFELLLKKHRSGSISQSETTEYQELLQITQNKALQRLALLVELSQLRGESLSDTMDKLGIKAVNPFNA